jgi:hypothetical protein
MTDRRAEAEQKVLGTITSISRDRILARLRGNSRAKRIHTAVVFEEVLNAWEVQSQRGRAGFTSSRERFASFEQTARRLQTLFNQCTSEAPREADLVEMVQLTSQLQKTSDLLQLLHRVQLSDNNPSLKDRLSRVLGAISRYSHVAKYLCRACRRIERLQNVTVQAVDLDSTAFFCPDATVDQPQLKSRLNTIRTRHNFDRNLESMYRLPEVTTLQGRNRFESTFENTIEQSKIHAEIQIVAFYDLEYPVELSPRVIRSHKEACSLCNLFIEVHGRYWTPGTHGRLYPGWRRPYIPTYRAFQVRLNELLEAQIAAVLREIIGSRRRLSMTYPNESANFSLPASTLSSSTIRAEPGSSSHAQGPDPGDGEHREQEFIEDEEGILDEELEEELDVDEDEDDDEETRGPGEDLSRQSDAPPTPITAMHAEGDESARVNEREAAVPLTAEISTIRLSPGEARVMDITPSGLSIRCSAGSLRVHMKYSNHLGTGQLRCRFEWLSDEEASQILAQNTSTIIAARSLSTATETPRRVLRQ